MDKTNRPKPVWSKAETFTDTATGVSVVVSKSDGRFPMFSMAVGRLRDDGTLNFNVGIREDRETGNILADFGTIVGGLVGQAQTYVADELQKASDMRKAFASERPDRGPRPGGDRGERGPKGPAIHRPGKTARDRAKRPGGGGKA